MGGSGAVALRLSRSPASVLALVKDNLNHAEDDVDRRRFLFANEATNQIQAGSDAAARIAAKAAAEQR